MLNLFIMPPILLVSSLLCLITNSWLVIWIMLEINTLAYCSMLKTFIMKEKESSEWSMKYFIIQSIASTILIFSMIHMKIFLMMKLLILTAMTTIMLKAASAPLHQWFVNMTKKIKWNSAMILMTWQKLAPIYLVLYQMKSLLMFFILASSFMGAILQMNKSKVLEILALSSVFNLSWMLMSMSVNTKVFSVWTILYWVSVVMVMMFLKKAKMTKMNEEKSKMLDKWICFIMLLNLAGIPPMPNFLMKVILLNEMIILKMMLILSVVLILSSINLYIYNRMMSNLFLMTCPTYQKNWSMMENLILFTVFMMTILPFLYLSL